MIGERLFVSGIANNVAEEVIRDYFSQFGQISEFTLPVERDTGINRGYAYVAYMDDTSTAKCLEESTHQIRNRVITVTKLSDEESLTKMESLKSKKLFVSFLGLENITEDSFRQAFSAYGNVTSVSFARDEYGELLYYAIVTLDHENAVDSCLMRNHCINGRSIVVRKAVTKEQFKLAEQHEREKASLEEHQKHGYAGYNNRLVAVPQYPTHVAQLPATLYSSSNIHQYDPKQEQYRMEYARYQLQLAEYQQQMAEYQRKLEKYHGELRRYQMQRQYKDALDQAGFHNAYNYNSSSQDISSPSQNNVIAQTELLDPLQKYGKMKGMKMLFSEHYGTNSLMCSKWRTLTEGNVTYDSHVEARDYFDKLISIWKTQCQSVNRRLFGTVYLSKDSEEYRAVIQIASQSWDCFSQEHDCDVRKLLYKGVPSSQPSYEVSFIEDELIIVFVPVHFDAVLKNYVHIMFPYKISCVQTSPSSLCLKLAVPTSIADVESLWLVNKMFPTLLKWLRFLDPTRTAVRKTISLLSIEEYSNRYQRLKALYGRQLVERWTEGTDPKKFVYEDCGIAAYLLELWKKRGWTPNKFADIGCGNGLLVYLLNREGVDGVGVDLRKRRVWSKLLSDTELFETAVDPSKEESGVPDGVDFLIGNHTDELTPWLPVMAARLSCGFFLLPCCPFNFTGKYVSRIGDSGSQYESFLRFVREICDRLGFAVDEDLLCIPSTKRKCFIGSIPPHGLVSNIESVIEQITGSATKPFIPRSQVEQVRNCLSVPKDVRVDLTKRFFTLLLERSDEEKDGWRCGGAVELGELAELLTPEEKQLMKQQCGGLQTFLRNQHQVFKVIGGLARIRDWREDIPYKSKRFKGSATCKTITPCWMTENHPDGCPLKDGCRFKH